MRAVFGWALAGALVGSVVLVRSAFPVGATARAQETLATDTVELADGKSHEGALFDLREKKVVLLVKGEKKTFPREQVKNMERAASPAVLSFFEKKFKSFAAEPKAEEWSKLARFCKSQEEKRKQSFSPERRRCLREIIKLEPDNATVRKELGHALLDGVWLDEDEVEAKLEEGMVLVDGKLLKKTSTVVKPTKKAASSAYRILTGENLTERQRKRYEKEREKRLTSATRFLEQKKREYEGVPWSQRHKIKTRNFYIHCNSTRKVAEAYGVLMELIRKQLAEMFPSRIRRNIRAPIFIYASQEDFMSQDEYGRWGGRGLGGYYVPPSQKIATFHGTFGFTGTTFSVLCHEGTHYYQGLVLEKFDNCPIWLIEGLAVYFGDGSTFDPKKGKITVGLIPRDRLAHIQEKMEAKRHTRIEELVGMRRGFGGFSGSHYADSWALIYFLVNSGEDGTKLMTEYWARGIEHELKKRDFLNLAKKYFGDIDTLQKQYEKYILALKPPPAGEVQGDYFVSDYFQFDLRRPGPEWDFFEDPDDKKMLVGLLRSGTSAEMRVYYSNNLKNSRPPAYFEEYLNSAKKSYDDMKDSKTKIAGLDGYKLTYVDDMKGSDFSIFVEGGIPVIREKKKGKKKGPQEVIEYKLIQIDGVLTIKCMADKGKAKRFEDDFTALKDSLTLMLTRRW